MVATRRTSETFYGSLLCPPKPSVSEYDDDAALTEYIWRYYQRLLTAAEARSGLYSAPMDRETAIEAKGVAFADDLDRTYGAVTSSELTFELRDGRLALFQRARDRILREHASEVKVNRCPACGRIVRSPGAKQCLWCKHDWHKAR